MPAIQPCWSPSPGLMNIFILFVWSGLGLVVQHPYRLFWFSHWKKGHGTVSQGAFPSLMPSELGDGVGGSSKYKNRWTGAQPGQTVLVWSLFLQSMISRLQSWLGSGLLPSLFFAGSGGLWGHPHSWQFFQLSDRLLVNSFCSSYRVSFTCMQTKSHC